MREYRVKKGIITLVYILASFVILFCGGMTLAIIIPPFNAITEEIHQSFPGLFVPVLFIIMILIMLLSVFSIKKRKVIITDKSIISISLFFRRELNLIDIKGFKDIVMPQPSLVNYIGIVPKESSKKKEIVISNLIEKTDDLKSYLNSSIADLDLKKIQDAQEKYQNEEKEILTNTNYGFTIEEREDKLKKARLFAKLLNGVTAVVIAWLFFYPRPYKYLVIVCVCLPLIGLLTVKLSKGLIKVDAEKESAYPTVVFPLMFPGIILFLRGIIDFSIEDYSHIWLPAILISLIFVAFTIVVSKKKTIKKAKDYFEIISYVLFGFIYGYSTVVVTNCVFDNSKPEIFASEVLSKTISGGRKGTFYDLNLSPWGKNTEANKITVDSNLYNNVEVGDEVSVYRFEGRFDIPWVVVDYPN